MGIHFKSLEIALKKKKKNEERFILEKLMKTRQDRGERGV